jgi:leader peptidase (prepilin peptidase) / N-methyltransferase
VTAKETGRGGWARARPTAAEASLIGLIGLPAIWASVAVAHGWVGVAGAALAILVIAITFTDRRAFVIPDPLNASAFLLGLATAALAAPEDPVGAVLRALARASVMFLAFFAFRAGYRRLRGFDGIGLGDVKLAAVAGAWLDWVDLPVAIDIAALAALATAALRRLRGESLGMRSKLPFGAFLAPAIWICWLLAAWRDRGGLGAALSTGL